MNVLNVIVGLWIIWYMKRISNFSQARQKEAAQRYYAPLR